MNKIVNRFILISLISLFHTINATFTVSIERYQPERDKIAIQKILNDHRNDLISESLGQQENIAILFKYINSRKYITDVLRVNNKTKGISKKRL